MSCLDAEENIRFRVRVHKSIAVKPARARASRRRRRGRPSRSVYRKGCRWWAGKLGRRTTPNRPGPSRPGPSRPGRMGLTGGPHRARTGCGAGGACRGPSLAPGLAARAAARGLDSLRLGGGGGVARFSARWQFRRCHYRSRFREQCNALLMSRRLANKPVGRQSPRKMVS
jgi:hypothetical protein